MPIYSKRGNNTLKKNSISGVFKLQLKLINSADSQIYSHDFELYQSSTVQSKSYAGAAPQFILCLK